jgi:hypothetical protein
LPDEDTDPGERCPRPFDLVETGKLLPSFSEGGPMVITMVEAEVASSKVEALQAMWGEVTTGTLPDGLKESFLLRAGDAWRIATVWESREALEAMRSSGNTPGALRVFAAAGAEPKLTIFEVEGHLEVP